MIFGKFSCPKEFLNYVFDVFVSLLVEIGLAFPRALSNLKVVGDFSIAVAFSIRVVIVGGGGRE